MRYSGYSEVLGRPSKLRSFRVSEDSRSETPLKGGFRVPTIQTEYSDNKSGVRITKFFRLYFSSWSEVELWWDFGLGVRCYLCGVFGDGLKRRKL